MPVVWTHNKDNFFLERPDLATPLWRYMSISKFLAMLVNSGIYMSRLDRLGDKYEGWVPNLSYKGGFFKKHFEDRDQELRKISPKERKCYYVSCWHSNEEQSDAMWKLYTNGNEGVAIRTTTKSLHNSLKDTPKKLAHYKVIYSNSDREPTHGGSMLRACLTKRLPFEHEKETRIVWYNDKKTSNSRRNISMKTEGFYVKCDLEILIEQVFIAPTEKPWLAPLVEDLLNKYSIKAEVIQSGLSIEPPA
ncbi:DUF2971 domain-containing protein [uncultured Desulfosarcina sp.]|uniref:DUF2971 domain-containing protein n=1 Tax=uncultured Desulfosarcina sp. TaxID=218289 RepID=UPI0029C7468B|nr:DUF2971 domain-containing protein [uncultured Desulfosarcina sp.]